MNRRKFLGFLTALFPCAIVARMLGEREVPKYTPPPTPNLAYKTVPYEATMFSPTTGFHTEIRELGRRYSTDEDGNEIELLPCFRATIRDCSGNPSQCGLLSPVWDETSPHAVECRRRALDALYRNVAEVIRRRQFPKDTLIYDQEITVNGVKIMNPRYPK